MELPDQLLTDLSLLKNMPDQAFQAVSRQAVAEAANPAKREQVSALLVQCGDVSGETVRRAHAALLAAVVAHVQQSATEEPLLSWLRAAGCSGQRQTALLQLVSEARPEARHVLAGIGHEADRLVEVQWRELATLQSSMAGAATQSEFVLSLLTEGRDGQLRRRQLRCSRDQLQQTVEALRAAGSAVEKLAEGR